VASASKRVSYHLPFETIEVFVDRLEDPYILFDDVTAEKVQAVRNSSANKKLSVASLLEADATEVPLLQLFQKVNGMKPLQERLLDMRLQQLVNTCRI
jgi:hypothetical protein